jgi:hypothetical protein
MACVHLSLDVRPGRCKGVAAGLWQWRMHSVVDLEFRAQHVWTKLIQSCVSDLAQIVWCCSGSYSVMSSDVGARFHLCKMHSACFIIRLLCFIAQAYRCCVPNKQALVCCTTTEHDAPLWSRCYDQWCATNKSKRCYCAANALLDPFWVKGTSKRCDPAHGIAWILSMCSPMWCVYAALCGLLCVLFSRSLILAVICCSR